MVGGAHHRLVVLHDEHRVAEVAQVLERFDQPVVVHRMEADGRLVADVEHAHQAGADLRGEADALPLASAERPGGATEREVLQADVEQEGEAGVDLLEDLVGDGEFAVAQRRGIAVVGPAGLDGRRGREPLRGLRPRARIGDGEGGHLHNGAVGDGHGERLGAQAVAAARLAGERGHIALDLAAHIVGLRFVVAALQVGDDALVGGLPLEDAPRLRPVPHAHLALVGVAVEERPPDVFRQLPPGRVH